MNLSRRLLLGSSLALCGCAADSRPVVPTVSSFSQSAGTAEAPVTSLSPTTVPRITRDHVRETFGRQTPGNFGLDVTGVLTRLPRDDSFALTFDACGGPMPSSPGMAYDSELISVLRRFKVPATLFLNHRWLKMNRETAIELAHDSLFELANHGTRHIPLSVSGASAYGIKGSQDAVEVFDEIDGAQAELTRLTGRAPRFFRSGTAHVDETSVSIVKAYGLEVVNFRVNADAGATASPAQVVTQLRGVRGGDIVIAHFNRPSGGTAKGFAQGLSGLLDSGLKPVRLSELL